MRPLPAAVRNYIDAAKVCRIATVRPDGDPHVIPVCPVFDGESAVYVDLDPDSVSGRAVVAHPRVAVDIDDYDDDWSKLRRVLLHCRVEVVTGEEQDRAWEQIRRKFPQYTTVDWQPRLTLALRIERWVATGIS